MSQPPGPQSRAPLRLSPPAAAVLTFVAAASVLVLEIAAARLLAPYVGVTLTTYTGIIGVILAGIALGAWVGGKAADAIGPEPLLGPTLALGGLAAMASVPIVTALGDVDVAPGVGEVVILATAGFVLPATVLSAVAPMIVKASLTDLAETGSLVGRLSAIGTVGAITGTFLTGFVLLGLIPTRLLIIGVGGLLVVLGVALTIGLRRSIPAAVLAVAGLLAGFGIAAGALATTTPCDVESRYYCISIVIDRGDPTRRLLNLDGLSHAFVDTDDPRTVEFGYLKRFADASASLIDRRGGRIDVLHIGGGGFTFPRYLAAEHPESRHTVLELDPTIVEVNEEQLGLEASEQIEIVIGDARLSIEGLPSDSFDVVAGDAFGGLAVPWHLTTSEFLAEVDRVLRPDGLYVMNVIDYAPYGFARAEARTLARLFGEVTVVSRAPVGAVTSGGNLVLVASHEPIDLTDLEARITAHGEGDSTGLLSGQAALASFVGDAPLLTDDFAPVDQLLGR